MRSDIRPMPRVPMVIPVRGVKAMETDLSEFSVGDLVYLRPNPTNPVDPHAVQVCDWGGGVLGYVPRLVAERIEALEWTAEIVEVLEYEGRKAGLRIRLVPKNPDR